MSNLSKTRVHESVWVAPDNPKEPASISLCVDLDGTLLATDVLWESILLLLKQRPWALLAMGFWILRGRAHLKRRIAEHVILDPHDLPYRSEVLSFLQQQKKAGRTLVLATAADHQPAEAIATHLGIFSDVIASDGIINLKGQKKLQALVAQFGKNGFDYMGDSAADLVVWESARSAILVNPSPTIVARAQKSFSVERVFSNRPLPLEVVFKALRVHQWVKNLLLFLPLIASHQLLDGPRFLDVCVAFLSFSFCASSVYLFNDLMDLPSDRRHPQKKSRPLANGDLSISLAASLVPILFVAGLLLSVSTLPLEFSSLLGLYALATFAYSYFLKQIPILDVLTLAGFYTLRVFAGGIAANVPISAWLLAFSMFLFLSLAFGKRHSELMLRSVDGYQGLDRRGYVGIDKESIHTMGTVSGYMSVLVLALYINSQDVLALYQKPDLLWLACPLLLYWISRTWLLASRNSVNEDPLVRALTDPQSYSVAAAIILLGILAT